MKSLCDPRSSSCVAFATKVLGDKWTPLLITVLLDGTLRFGEISEQVPGLNPRTLSARLSNLEKIGVINRKNYPTAPPKVEYTLTQKGVDLYPILNDMEKWGEKYSLV